MASRPDPDEPFIPGEPTGDPPPSPEPDPAHPLEVGGRGGLDPVRYGDWEKGGIAVDF